MFSKGARQFIVVLEQTTLHRIPAHPAVYAGGGLLLACGLGVFYSIVVRHAFAEDNAVLADKMFALSADLRENGPEGFAEEITAHRAGQHTPYWIRILDSQGRAIAETPQMDRLIPTQIFPVGREPTEASALARNIAAQGSCFPWWPSMSIPVARFIHFSWHKTAQVTSKLKGISLCYSSWFSSAALWPRL